MNKQRLEAFTDAILAIIMTIMVLEIHAPDGFSLAAMRGTWIPLFAYAVSFCGLANLWASHHYLFEKIHRVSYGLFLANMALILWVSLYPSATAWVAEYPTHFVPQASYMVLQFGWTILLLNLQRMCRKSDPEFRGNVIGRTGVAVTLITQVICAALSFFVPYISLIGGTLIIILYIFRPNDGEWRIR